MERAALLACIADVLDSGYYVMGGQHAAFEQEFAAFVGSEHAAGVANGTDALQLALLAVGVAPGESVLMAANAGGYATTAARVIGAVPRYADVDALDLQLDPDSVARALAEQAISAVVTTHLFGNPAPVAAIAELCREAAVPLIEDCAQATGLRIEGRHVGTWGAASTFSFYPTKNLGALGDAGAVVTNDVAVVQRVTQLRQYGWTAKYTVGTGGGRNSRLDEIQAAVLRVRLPHVVQHNDRRREVIARYSEAFSPQAGRMVSTTDGVGHLAVALVADRNAARAQLAQACIGTDIHYPIPDHRQPAWRQPGAGVHLPVTEHASVHILTLPCFPEMTEAEVARVCEVLHELS